MSETPILRYTTSQCIWLITGSSSGFGLEVTKQVLQNGGKAAAAYRPSTGRSLPATLSSLQSSLPPSQVSNLLLLPCDIASPSQISAAFTVTHSCFGRIDVVFNGAGCAILGEIEGTPEDHARKMFDVNFWGMCNVSREAVKVFREVNGMESPGGKMGGMLLNVSSGAGVVPNAGIGYYCASKHGEAFQRFMVFYSTAEWDQLIWFDVGIALEGFTEALAKEMDPAWNIKIIILEPGAFKTCAHTDNTAAFPVHHAYTSNQSLASHQVRQWFADRRGITGDPVLAAERIYKLTMASSFGGIWDGDTNESAERGVPLRLQLGDDSWSGIKATWEGRLEEMQWSRELS